MYVRISLRLLRHAGQECSSDLNRPGNVVHKVIEGGEKLKGCKLVEVNRVKTQRAGGLKLLAA